MFFLTSTQPRRPLRLTGGSLSSLLLLLLLLLLTSSVFVAAVVVEGDGERRERRHDTTASPDAAHTSLQPRQNLSEWNERLRRTFAAAHVSASLRPPVTSCSAEHGCPQSSMVWATGTFTHAAVLTPASFLIAANLTLKMSLCCGYKFNGRLLREEKLYDAFLHTLLHATPFQVLTWKEKRDMFPREHIMIVDTGRQRHYNTTYILTEEDREEHNDGDGDVIVLLTGAVGSGIQRVLQYPRAGGDATADVSAEIQLKVANVAIKCKCPHTLLVMPILRVRPDTLPPVSIVGLGSHCGTQQQRRLNGTERVTTTTTTTNTTTTNNNNNNNSNTHHYKEYHIVQLPDNSWAVSFAVSPPLPAATAVHWIVTDTTTTTTTEPATSTTSTGSDSSSSTVVLNESFHIPSITNNATEPLLLLHSANSSYFKILPHHKYTVHVTLTRGMVTQTTSGVFVLRLPFKMDWDVRRQPPEVHFGIERRLRLSEETRAFNAVRRALAPLLQHSPARYYGYWENTPLEDQPLPQQPRRVRDNNPFTAEYEHEEEQIENTTIYSLFVGRNDISFYVLDVDEVCDPTLLETHEVWSVQALLLQPETSPTTACHDDIPLKALALKRLLATMQELRQLAVEFAPPTLWDFIRRSQQQQQQWEKDIMEGYFNCTERGVGPCRIHPTVENSGTSAVLKMQRRGVAELSWVVHVVVHTSRLIPRDNVDSTHARLVAATGEEAANTTGVVVVELHSRTVLVVRRMSTMPTHVTVSLPMHLRLFTVHPPRPLEATTTQSDYANNRVDETPPLGRWQVAPPLRIVSIDESLVLLLDTTHVPNVQQALPTSTLRYIAEDYGAAVDDIGTPYTSRCPPRVVEHTVMVVARAAPPVVPAVVPVYTENSCVRLQAPRAAWKDESTRWHIPPCAEATQPPYLVRQEKQGNEVRRMEGETIGGDNVSAEEVTVCGVEVHKWCDVEWTARNLLGAVTQTFSLRRCQKPPQLLFHRATPQGVSRMPLTVYSLPYIEWLEEEDIIDSENGATTTGTSTTTTDGVGVRRYYTARPVLPLAGYNTSISYSFNYTGLQEDFEAYFTYAHDAAHQLGNTRSHYEPVQGNINIDIDHRNDVTDALTSPLLLRRFVRSSEDKSESNRYALGKSSNNNKIDNVETTAIEYKDAENNNNNNNNNEDDNEYYEQLLTDGTSRRDHALDIECDARFSITQNPAARHLQLHGISDSSLYPLLYVVRLSPHSHAPSRDAAEFNRRGMCTARTGNISVLAVNPRGVVQARKGGVIPFCQPSFIFSRHPWLSEKYHFDFSWSCDNEFGNTRDSGITVEKHTPTLSIFRHTGSGSGSNETHCNLTVHNTLTDTTQTDTFLLRRVYPTGPPSAFVLLSDNTDTGSCVANNTTRVREASNTSTNGSSTTTTTTTTTTAGTGTGGTGVGGKTRKSLRWVVGKSVVLHVDAPMRWRTSKWRAISVIPAVPTSMGTQFLLDSLQFLPLTQHPRALARGAGGATVLVSGIRVPGIYTFAHHHPDPSYPNVCPNVSFVETLHVTHAQVIEKELTVCGDTAVLRAVPIPREIACNFVGQWEVVSVQRSRNETWSSGAEFTGMQFDRGTKPHTQVRGLPFGIVTIRWAIYALSPIEQRNDTSQQQQQQQQQRILVDYDTVRLFVLTENLRSHRFVTLSNRVDILTTTSTQQWKLLESPGLTSSLTLHRPRFRLEVISNTSDRSGMGFEVLILENLPIGTTRLQYELHPSLRVFGPMQTKNCPSIRRQQVEVERVSAFLSVNATFDHECDAYTGRGRFSICLHAERVRGSGTNDQPSTRENKKNKEKRKGHDGRDEDASPFGVRLVDPAVFEGVVKSGAARLVHRGCALPWWITARWEDVRSVDADGRCVSFRVTATRHLRAFELSRPLFRAVGDGDVGRYGCVDGSDVVTSEVIAGSPTTGDSAHTGRLRRVRGESEREVVEPDGGKNNGMNVRVDIREGEREGVAAFLPFLNPATLTRVAETMRPMLSLRGDPDVVVSELDISDTGAAVVVLRLDTTHPLQVGGYTYTQTAPHSQKQEKDNDTERRIPNMEEEEGQQQQQEQQYSLLSKCVRGTLRGLDVLQFWSEVNRPDGLEGHTANEWLEYVEKVRDAHVVCEPLFASLDHFLPRHDDTDAALQSRRARRLPPKEQRLVSLDVVLQQLEGLQQEYRWTRDGIDVTGLPADLQTALSRRRITKSQLEEIARLRREHEEKQHKQTDTQQVPLIKGTPRRTSREERFERAMRLYKGVLNEDIAAVRLTLPRHQAFTVPHNLFLRTAIHKDVLCGTNISGMVGAAIMPVLAPPESLVLFGRVEVVDVPPAVSATPAAVKQCEVEGGIPLIHVNVSGTRFADLEPFPKDRIVLDELRNPNWTDTLDSPPDVGLTPCLQQMHAGMKVSTSQATRKQMYLQLAPCPFFQMLSHADYNENQNSELLQRKLQLPRLLRVTLRDVLSEDSHIKGKTSVSLVVEIRPTLARLHLRVLPDVDEAARGSPWSELTNKRPLLICESDVRQKGMELGVELIGDEWNDRVGEETGENDAFGKDEDEYGDAAAGKARAERQISAASHALDDTSAMASQDWGRDAVYGVVGSNIPHGRGQQGIRRRSPHNVALINSFSVVEHHSLDSAHHLFLRHGGIYRSNFVNYLFSTVLADPENIRRHRFIQRYNNTFASVCIPAEPRDADDQGSGGNGKNTLLESDYIPPIRPFSTIEEILFAVPGIATECRGCLLADTTYFVAGDLTGLWSFPPATLPPLDNSLLAAPLRIPFYVATRVPREWRFTMVCPTAAWRNLRRLWQHWQSPHLLHSGGNGRKHEKQAQSDRGELQLELELVVYSLRDMLGGEVPLSKRPTILLTSAPISVATLLHSQPTSSTAGSSGSEIVFHVNTSAAERAHAMMAADFVRYGRRHLHTVYDYVRDETVSGAALAINSSVFLKVCVPPTMAVSESQCSIVSITHSLLLMEEPRTTASYYAQLRRASWSSVFYPPLLIHHVGTTLLGYFIFPRVPALTRMLVGSSRHNVGTARNGITVMLFVAVMFFYHLSPHLWMLTCILLWATLLRLVPRAIVVLYSLLHFLIWAVLL